MQQTMNKFMRQASGLMQTKMSKCMRLLGLLMLFLFVGIGNAWGEEATITFSTTTTKISSAEVTGTDSDGKTWTVATEGTTSFTANQSYYQVGSSKSPATSITFTATRTDEITITGIEAKFGGFNSTAGTITVYIDNIAVGSTGSLNGTNDVIASTGSISVAAQNKEIKVTVTGISKGVKVYYIKYTYTSAGGATCTTLTTPSVTATAGDGEATLAWEAVANASSYSLVWNDGEAETVTSPVTKEGLTNGTAYTYSLVAVGDGENYCNSVAASGSVMPNITMPTSKITFEASQLDGTNSTYALKSGTTEDVSYSSYSYTSGSNATCFQFNGSKGTNILYNTSAMSAGITVLKATLESEKTERSVTPYVATEPMSSENYSTTGIALSAKNITTAGTMWVLEDELTEEQKHTTYTYFYFNYSTSNALYVSSFEVAYNASAPLISVSDFDLGSVEVNGSLSNTLTVTGSNLTEVITYSLAEGESSAFTVAGELTAAGGTLNVALKSTETKGIFSDQLTLTSGETTKTITLTAKVTGAYSVAEIITEANSLGLTSNANSIEDYTTVGYIKEITTIWNATYKNITFEIADKMNAIQSFSVYRATVADGTVGAELHVGDKVSVTGKITNYNGTTLEYAAGTVVTLLEAVQFTITATAADGDMGTVTGGGTFGYNASVTLTASPKAGYEFVNWKEDGVVVEGAGAEFTFNATADRTLVAYFQVEGASTVVISASADYAYRGSVSGADSYAVGTNATLTATPKTGYQFVNWTEDGTEVSTAAEYTFNVANVRTLVANFAVKEYITVAEAIEIAKATPLSTDAFTIKGYVKAVNNNKQITLTDNMNAEPEQETFWAYNNSGWGANATQVGDYVQIEEATLTTYNNTPESTGGTLTVLSSPEYTVTVDVVENGFISLIVNEEDIESGASVIRGKEVKLVIMPDVDYRLQDGSLVVYKSGDNSTTVTVNDNKFTMPMYDVRIYAAFEQIPDDEYLAFHIPARASIVKGESSYDEETGLLAAPAGDNVVLPTATVPEGNEGWVFYGWATAEQTTQTNILPANVVKASELYTLNETAELYALYVHISDKGYCKVTENRGDWSGQYLIVRENEAMAFNGSLTSSTSTKLSDTNNAIGIALSNDKADLAAETAIESLDDISFKIAAYDGGWSIKSASGYYIGYASSSSTPKADIKVNETTQYKNTIEISENEHIALINSTVTNSNSIAFALEYNNSSSCFRYYAGTMAAIHLYRKSVKETFAFTPGEIVPVQYGVYYYEGATPATEVTNMPEDNPVSVNEGETYTITSTIPVREGYTFLGWKLDGTETIYHAGDEITINENDIEFYAQWRSENVIVFDFTDANELTAWGLAIPETGNGTDLTDGTVLSINFCSLTYAKGEASTDTRIWATNNGLELRTYAGSKLTVSLPAHYAVETIEVNGVVNEDAEHNPMLEIEGANKIKTVTVSYTKDAAAPAVPDINVPTNGITNLTCNANTITVQAEGVLSVTNNVTVNEFVLQANGANKPEVVLNGDVIVVGNVYLEWELKLDENYPFTLPCDVEWSGIEYWDGSAWDDNFAIQVAEYNGEKRATDGTTNGSNWQYVSDTKNGGKLLAHKGYIMKVASSDNSITGPNVRVRFPLNALKNAANKLTEDAELAVSANSSANATNAGWNYVGNPFLHSYQGTYGGQNYIAVTNDGGHTFTTKLSDGQTVTPFSPFFVQVASGEALNFATAAASMPELRAAVEYNARLFAELTLDADQMGIWMSDRYTTAYEINADFGKIFGSAQATAIYTVTGGNRLAYNALPDAAAQAIPVGFSAAAGEHTLALREGEGFAHLYLTDKLMNTVTDLLTEDYTFTTEGDNMNESRFELNAVRAEAGTPTGVAETVSHEGIHKVLLNGKVYIVREGVWYDVMGKIVK